ncbi:MAG: MBL fold metallo-hydrolase [Deltaproteobacteria bacterium]|nr:MBL fold metallo-hydrolase [Deltaproteobacteria bacterium]MDZ4341822.1 MBL fold metallo-hydrolase [Candidatus Binatia bacterium]
MKLHILGCGDAFGSGGRNQSAYLVEADARPFLLDCGPTTLLAMKRAGIDPRRLDVVFISHLHGDHFGGLPFLFIEFLYRTPRDKPLHIAGPPGTEEKAYQLFRLMYGGSTASELPPVDYHILHPGKSVVIEGIEVLPFRVPHQTHEISLGLKIQFAGKQILFSGDSAWSEIFIEHARGVDLFLCECSFYDQSTDNHVRYVELLDALPRMDCKKFVLTHLGEAMLARRKELTLAVAEDGMVIEI